MNPKECVLCVCIFGVTLSYVIEGIDSIVISVCLINDYLYFARAECESISLKCTKVKLSILNNFDRNSSMYKICQKIIIIRAMIYENIFRTWQIYDIYLILCIRYMHGIPYGELITFIVQKLNDHLILMLAITYCYHFFFNIKIYIYLFFKFCLSFGRNDIFKVRIW